MFTQNSKLSLLILSFLIISFIQMAKSEIQPSVIKLPTEFSGDSDKCSTEDFSRRSCPVKCFRTDPVCGENGVTYWCGCADAHCAGIRVVKLGFCEVGNGGSSPLSGQAFLLVHLVWLIVLGFSVLCVSGFYFIKFCSCFPRRGSRDHAYGVQGSIVNNFILVSSN
ncbi:Solute carrier organic anion transporter family member 1B1 [Bienertia sinuspersici]